MDATENGLIWLNLSLNVQKHSKHLIKVEGLLQPISKLFKDVLAELFLENKHACS